MSIQYPEFLEQCLVKNKRMRAAVDGTVASFAAWLRDSKLPFFADYTDHGPDHLSCVMRTAVALLPPEAQERFSAEDAASLILAILLHDSALHLSEAGFHSLIVGKAAVNRIANLDTDAWPELWEDYLFSAKRWDDQRLKDVFGTDDAGAPRGAVRDPFDSYDDLKDTDRKLIGEFIRMHHARLAHEFAVFGVPGPSPDLIKPSPEFDTIMSDIAGLVARSHGMPMRKCLDYLQERKYPIREFLNMHAIYLMALLRVADFLHVDATRTSEVVFRYKHIPSKYSELEHKAHLAVKSITRATEDPEAILVTAHPEDVQTFLRIKSWLGGIQSELDQSWAVLGEVYGRFEAEGLSNLGLNLRRVRSNLDNVADFARSVIYVPEHIGLDVARADFLKLLIGPLYGDKPSVGVRELMQNAVDAVRELRAFTEKHPSFSGAATLLQDADVEITLACPDAQGNAWLTVSDKGIGMTEEVIRDFFLKAGASFRSSDAWKKEFETAQATGENEKVPKSRVLRSGRFGVGALAAFLLGEEIHVSTRHITAAKGIRFLSKLDLQPVELRYDDTLLVGTTIRVKSSPKTYEALMKNFGLEHGTWDWYCLDDPKVTRIIKHSGQNLPQTFAINRQELQAGRDWKKILPAGYEAVFWSYGKAPTLMCNGIRVGDISAGKLLCNEGVFSIKTPNVCVFDPDGVLPLNLQRSNLSVSSYPFGDLLLEDVSRDILASLLVNTPTAATFDGVLNMPKPPGYVVTQFIGQNVEMSPWVVTTEGICPCTIWNLWYLDFKCLLFAIRYRHRSGLNQFEMLGEPPQTIPAGTACLMFGLWGNARSKYAFLNGALRDTDRTPVLRGYALRGRRLLTTSEYVKHLFDVTSFSKRLKREMKKEWENQDWCFLADPGCPSSVFSDAIIASLPKPDDPEFCPPLAVEVYLSKGKTEPTLSVFERLWKEIIGYPVIPFDPEKRREVLAKAYDILQPYLEFHQASREKAVKARRENLNQPKLIE